MKSSAGGVGRSVWNVKKNCAKLAIRVLAVLLVVGGWVDGRNLPNENVRFNAVDRNGQENDETAAETTVGGNGQDNNEKTAETTTRVQQAAGKQEKEAEKGKALGSGPMDEWLIVTILVVIVLSIVITVVLIGYCAVIQPRRQRAHDERMLKHEMRRHPNSEIDEKTVVSLMGSTTIGLGATEMSTGSCTTTRSQASRTSRTSRSKTHTSRHLRSTSKSGARSKMTSVKSKASTIKPGMKK